MAPTRGPARRLAGVWPYTPIVQGSSLSARLTLVAARRDGKGADVALDVAARLTIGEGLDEDRLALRLAHVLDLVRHRREDGRRPCRDLRHAALLAELRRRGRAGDLELCICDEEHRVDRVLVRRVLGARREGHLDEARHAGDLGNGLVEVRAGSAAVGQPRGKAEWRLHGRWSLHGRWRRSGGCPSHLLQLLGEHRKRVVRHALLHELSDGRLQAGIELVLGEVRLDLAPARKA